MVKAYGEALRKLKLPAHPTLVFDRLYQGFKERQSEGFWTGKSKAPYEWGPADTPGRIPWCAFVGYQVRYDGVLRIRPSSIKKEIVKHNHILNQIRRFLAQKGQVRSKKQILYRFRQRFRSITVGSGTIGDGLNTPAFSWTQGFLLLRKYPSLSGQLRNLDRHRVACIRALSRELQRRGIAPGSGPVHDGLAFEGFPFSYAGLVERNSRWDRARNQEYMTSCSGRSTGLPFLQTWLQETTTASERCASTRLNSSGVGAGKRKNPEKSYDIGNWWSSVSSCKMRELARLSAVLLVLSILIGYALFVDPR